MSRFKSKPERQSEKSATPVLVLTESVVSLYPTLIEYMTVDAYDDGAARETTTLTIFAEEGGLKACVKDREGDRVAFVTGDSFEAILGAVERGLADDSLDWRVSRNPSRRGGAKKR